LHRIALGAERQTPTGQTAYDSMYVAVAVRLDTRAITADNRLIAALTASPAVTHHINSFKTLERDG